MNQRIVKHIRWDCIVLAITTEVQVCLGAVQR